MNKITIRKNISKQEIRKLAMIGRTITQVHIEIPAYQDIIDLKQTCERIFKSRIYLPYVRQLAFGIYYAHRTRNLKTHQLLEDDIRSGKKIYLKNYDYTGNN